MVLKTLIGGGIGCALSAALLISSPASAAARPNAFLKGQRQLEVVIDARRAQLATLVQAVNEAAAGTLRPAHELVLAMLLTAQQSTIAALASKVAADRSLSNLASDRGALARDDRPFKVITNEVHLTITADGESAMVSALQLNAEQFTTELAGHPNQQGLHAANRTARALTRVVVSVTSLIGGVVTSVLSVVPQSGGASAKVLTKASNQLNRAKDQLATAQADDSAIARFLASHDG